MSSKQYSIGSVGEKLESFLQVLISSADLRLDFEMVDDPEKLKEYFEGPSLVVRFSGPDVQYLMANKAEGLLALEQIVQEMLRMQADEHAMLCFDANDYRLNRMNELRLSALTVAQRVKESKMAYRFNPMNSRERRIVHLSLSDDKELRSESAGMGPQRHVVVYPAGMPSLPSPPPGPPMGGRPPMRRGRR
jgi:spoIIIJ-associated protein